MKQSYRFRMLCLLAWISLSGSLLAQTPPPGISGQAFRDWIKVNFYDGFHTTLGYSTARSYMYGYIDNQNNTLTDVYGGYQLAWPYGSTGTNPAPLNCEHTVPQSFFGSLEPMRSDIHHLFPTLDIWNSTRSNYPLADIADNATTKWMRDNQSQTTIPTSLIEEYSEYASLQFEPREDHKGDAARAIFYFYTMYPTQAGPIGNVGDLNTFYQWHIQDPVDADELNRNDGIEIYQGNRNPYVDNPSWVVDAWEISTGGTAPNAPVLSLSAATSSLQLSWADLTDEDGYTLYRSADGTNYSQVASLGANVVSYTDNALSNNTTYYYYATAYNTQGTSAASNLVSGQTTGGGTGGGPASDLFLSEYIEGSSFNKALEIANFTGTAVNLSGYVLKKETNGGGVWGSDYALSGTLADGEVWVIANSSASATILSQADVSTGSAIVTFNGNDVIGLFYNGSLIDVIGTFGSAAIFAQDQTLVRKSTVTSPNPTYTTAEWDFYPSDTDTDLGSHTFDGGSTPTPPATPANLSLIETTIDLNLSWDDVANEDGYSLYRSTDNVNFAQIAALGADVTAYTDNSVQLLTPYYYYVVAFNADGSSGNSNVVSGQTEPTGPFASDLFFSEYIEGSSFNKALEIANYTGAPVDLSAYVLKKQTNGAGAWADDFALSGTLAHGAVWILANSAADPVILAEADATSGAGIVSFNGNDALALFKNGTELDVIGYFNNAANYAQDVTLIRKASIESPNVSYTPNEWDGYPTNAFADLGIHTFTGGGINPPAAPTNLALTETPASLDLSWDDVSNEAGYYLFRSTDNVSYSQIASLTPNTTAYVDNSITLESLYYYYVVAYNADGNSGNSNVVSGQTLPSGPVAGELFISEYVEGSSRNRAIEIANFTGAPVDLSQYSLRRQANGGGNWRNNTSLSGTLADGAVYIVAHSSAAGAVTSLADQLINGGVMNFSGNDPVGLFKNGTLIDIVGTFNGGSTNFAANVTLVRKASVTDPTTSYTTSEWDSYSSNTFTYLGSHAFGNPPAKVSTLLTPIKAWPNPFQQSFVLRMELRNVQTVEIQLFNLMGQPVQTLLASTELSAGVQEMKFSVAELPAGLYLLRVKQGTETQVLRMMKR